MFPSIADDPAYKGALSKDFAYGFASASYQIEGAREDRGDCLWDRFLAGKDNGDIAADSYHLFEEDLKCLKAYGATSYRFSVSWPRVIPKGGKSDPVNQIGLNYYIHMVNRLMEEGIEPWVTIFHWDTPIDLEERYGGWTDSQDFYDDWLNFCRVLFEALGDKVTKWWTINEPHIWVKMNHAGLHPNWNGRVDPWKLGRVVLLAHAKAVELYRREFQPRQKGKIGVVLNADWVDPIDDSQAARDAAYAAVEAHLGWFADPIFRGHQNKVLKDKVGADLPDFSEDEMALLYGSSDDMFGLNHYGTTYATGEDVKYEDTDPLTYLMGSVERTFFDRDMKPIGVRGQNGHPYIVAWGFRKLLRYINERYTGSRKIPIIIAENGFPVDEEAKMSITELVKDTDRQQYFAEYIRVLVDCVRDDGILITGYMAWSLIDNLEWMAGYYPRFGVTHIDRENGCQRTPKQSAFLLKAMFEHLVEAEKPES